MAMVSNIVPCPEPCPSFLGEQERFRWYLPDHIKVYADLEGHKVNGGTIPQEMVVTSSLPDLVIVDNSTPVKTVYLFELTVSNRQTTSSQLIKGKWTDTPLCQLTLRREDTAARTYMKSDPGGTGQQVYPHYHS